LVKEQERDFSRRKSVHSRSHCQAAADVKHVALRKVSIS